MSQKIKYSDLRVGDKIRTVSIKGDVEVIRTGVVGEIATNCAWSTKGVLLVLKSGRGTIELLDRPKPSKPGTVIIAKDIQDMGSMFLPATLILDEENYWHGVDATGKLLRFRCSREILDWQEVTLPTE